MKRGLTLIEMLAALSLVAGVAAVSATWLREAAQTTARVTPVIRWRSAAEAVLRLIEDDIVLGDVADGDEPRVEVEDGILLMQTRGHGEFAGTVEHAYRVRPAEGSLELEERKASGKERTRLLLDQVKRFEVKLDPASRRLEVTIESDRENGVSREFANVP